MKPLVSVIVPTKNSKPFLEACLQSIMAQTYPKIELVVIDNNSTDKTKEVATKYTKLVFNKGPERSAQRNYGAKKSKGEYLLFIDSDMELSSMVVEDCVKQFHDKNKAGVIIPEKSFGEGFWAKCKVLERSFYIGIDWMEAARFYSRSAFDLVGGYDEANTGTEDYDLPHRLQNQFGSSSIGRIGAYINHNERRISLFGTCKKKYYYARNLRMYKDKPENKSYFSSQVSLVTRYKVFFRDPKKLFYNPTIGLGMLFMKTAEFAFGGIGYLGSSNALKRHT